MYIYIYTYIFIHNSFCMNMCIICNILQFHIIIALYWDFFLDILDFWHKFQHHMEHGNGPRSPIKPSALNISTQVSLELQTSGLSAWSNFKKRMNKI